MTLAETLLEKLSSWHPPADAGRHSMTAAVPAAGVEVTVTADRVDSVGAVVREIEVTRTTPAADPTPVADRAARVAGRVRGLSENLRVLEVDPTRDEAVLRSDEPAARGADRDYYEVVLSGSGGASVKRYHATPGARREAVAFPLTHDTIARVAGALGE